MTDSTLVLYDTPGEWRWLGELYAIMSANLAVISACGQRCPSSPNQTGQLKQYTVANYISPTSGEPIPNAS